MIDWIKGALLGMVDAANAIASPFEPFDRPADVLDNRPLRVKDAEFWKEIGQGWVHGPFYWSMRPNDGGDMAIWHGCYVAACAARGDWAALSNALRGASLLQKLGGNDRLARGADQVGCGMGIDPSRKYYTDKVDGVEYVFHDNGSESTLIGHLFGLWAVLQFEAPQEHREQAARLAHDLALQLEKDGDRMLNQDGSPAKFGDLRPGPLTAPIRVAALAAVYCLAWRATTDPRWLRKYHAIRSANFDAISRPETHFLWVHPWYQDAIAYMVLTILATSDGGGYAFDYQRGLDGLWDKTGSEGNAFYAYLRKIGNGKLYAVDAAGALKTLREFNADRKLGPRAKDSGKAHGGGEVRPFTWGWSWAKGGKLLSRQPVPVWRRAPQDFAWQRCPYSIGGEEHADFNGLDYCLAYWLGRRSGAIRGDD